MNQRQSQIGMLLMILLSFLVTGCTAKETLMTESTETAFQENPEPIEQVLEEEEVRRIQELIGERRYQDDVYDILTNGTCTVSRVEEEIPGKLCIAEGVGYSSYLRILFSDDGNIYLNSTGSGYFTTDTRYQYESPEVCLFPG